MRIFEITFFLALSFIFSVSFLSAQPNGRIDIAKKIKEATPKSLPQSPAAEGLASDSKDRNLKGKVKSVTEDQEFLTGNPESHGRQRFSETYFNEQGMLHKEISYDSKGNPIRVAFSAA